VDPEAVVRAVLGYRQHGEFVPLIIASEVLVSDGAISVRFRPPAANGADVEPFERDLVLSAGNG
jgi:hypothetical protein